VPSHSDLPFAGVGQAVHDGPQAVFSVAETHCPLQRFFPEGQVPSHGSSGAIHELVAGQTFLPAGQATPHLRPSQVASPPRIDGQASQLNPQLAVCLLSTQMSEHL
jgi:hypothetical protein